MWIKLWIVNKSCEAADEIAEFQRNWIASLHQQHQQITVIILQQITVNTFYSQQVRSV